METLSLVITIAAIVLGVILLLRILAKPFRFFKLLLNTALGFVLLWIINFFGGEIGLTLSLSLVNALVVGFLGIPGVLLLLAIHFFL